MNITDHINVCKPWKRYKLQEFSRSAKRVITVLISKLTIIQAYTDVIYSHTQKKYSGGLGHHSVTLQLYHSHRPKLKIAELEETLQISVTQSPIDKVVYNSFQIDSRPVL